MNGPAVIVCERRENVIREITTSNVNPNDDSSHNLEPRVILTRFFLTMKHNFLERAPTPRRVEQEFRQRDVRFRVGTASDIRVRWCTCRGSRLSGMLQG